MAQARLHYWRWLPPFFAEASLIDVASSVLRHVSYVHAVSEKPASRCATHAHPRFGVRFEHILQTEGPEAPRAAGSACQIRFDPMNRCVALRRHVSLVGVGPTRSRFDSRPQGALGSSLSCGDLDGCCLCAELRGWWRPWPTAKRHVGVRMGRPFAASGAWLVRTWRAIRAIYVWVRPLR